MGRKTPHRRVHLIHWKPDTAASARAALRSAGFSVSCTAFAPALLRRLADHPPAVVVIDLSRLPSAGRDVGVVLRRAKLTRHIPLVFAGGTPHKVERVRALLPDASFTTWAAIGPVVRRAIRGAPRTPVIPDSSLAGYAGTPLLDKLGLEAGMTVGLIDAPRNIRSILGELPSGVRFVRSKSNEPDLTLWFVTSQAAIDRDVSGVAAALGSGRLWIIWPKRASGLRTDLTQAAVREAGLAHGLVDYKICAIDATWSGLKFVVRKR